MLKKRVLSLVLSLALLPLPGCAAMLERGHETITTHVDYAVTEDESVLRAETYQGLVSAMLYFVNEHRRGGTIRLYNYTGDVEADLANARDEVMYEDPLGAFSIHGFTYDLTPILTYYEVELRITYSRTAQEVDSLREVTGLAGVRQELKRLVAGQEGSAAFLASYFSGDKELVKQLLYLACMNAPELAAHHDWNYWPMSISLYPEAGTRRIIEVKLPPFVADEMEDERQYAQELETAAAAALEAARGKPIRWRSWPPSSAAPMAGSTHMAAMMRWPPFPGSRWKPGVCCWPWSTCASSAGSKWSMWPATGSL